jgi:hypothetical protein
MSSKITFNGPVQHLDPRQRALNREAIEVFRNGNFVAAIYPIDDGRGGIRIVTKHLDEVKEHLDDGGPPTVEIRFT